MKKYFNYLKIIFFLAFVSSCQKSDFYDIPKKLKTSEVLNYKNQISNWIAMHQYAKAKHNANLQSIEDNLEFDGISIEKRKNGEDLIIVPINGKMNEKLKLDQSYSLSLLTVRSVTGKMRWSMVVGFLPTDVKKRTKLRENTIQKLINDEAVEENGLFKFYDLKGKLLYQLVYKDKKMVSFAAPQAKNKTNDLGRNIQSNENPICIVWYLVTTYYKSDGSVDYETWEYLFTDCANEQDGDSDGGGGGPGGDDPSGPEEPIDTERTITLGVSVPQSSYQSEDIKNPTSTEIEYDDENNPIIPQPEPAAIILKYYVQVTYKLISRQITNVYASPISVDPASVTYVNPYSGTITRVISFTNTHQSASAGSAGSVNATWSGIQKYRWNYITAGGPPKTLDVPYIETKTFSIP